MDVTSSADYYAEFAELVGYAEAAAVQQVCQDAASVRLLGMDGELSACAAKVVESFARMQTDDIMSQRDALLALSTPSAVLTRNHQGAIACIALEHGFMRVDMLALCAIAADEERHGELLCSPQAMRAALQPARVHTSEHSEQSMRGAMLSQVDLHAVTAMHAQLQATAQQYAHSEQHAAP